MNSRSEEPQNSQKNQGNVIKDLSQLKGNNDIPNKDSKSLNQVDGNSLKASKVSLFTPSMPYEDFIKDKANALVYFSKMQKFSDTIDQTDAKRANGLLSDFIFIGFGIQINAIIFAVGVDRFLRRRNLINGVTKRNSIPKIIMCYCVFPTVVTKLLLNKVATPYYEPKLEEITKKYDFSDLKFKEAYEEEQKNSKK